MLFQNQVPLTNIVFPHKITLYCIVNNILIKLLTEGSALVNGDSHEPKD